MLTVTVNEQLVLVPAVSVAVQVTVLVPTAKLEPDDGVQLTMTPAQLSLTTGAAKVTATLPWPAGALLAIFPGQVIAGGCVSLTVTLKEQFAVPTVLDAVQVTALVPVGKVCGDVMTVAPIRQVTVGAGLPVTIGANAIERPHWPAALLVVMSD